MDPPSADMDRTVINLCAQFVSDHEETNRLSEGDRTPGGRTRRLIEDHAASAHEALAKIISTPARGLAGWQAKARVMVCLEHDEPDLAASLAADLLRVAEPSG
jgi:hypothetical protein